MTCNCNSFLVNLCPFSSHRCPSASQQPTELHLRSAQYHIGLTSSGLHQPAVWQCLILWILGFRESGKVFVCRGQGPKSGEDACTPRTLRKHCIKNRFDSLMEIPAWAQEHVQKTLCEHSSPCQMQVKARSCNDEAKKDEAHSEWTEVMWKTVCVVGCCFFWWLLLSC